MAGRLVIPQYMPAEDENGQRLPGAKLYVYVNKTTTLATTYTTNTLTVANTNPVIANASGVFPQIWAGNSEVFSVSVTDADGVPYVTYDDVDMSNTESSAAATLAENAALAALEAQADSAQSAEAAEAATAEAAVILQQVIEAAAGASATPAITAIGVLSPLANRLPMYTGPTTATLLPISPYMQATLSTTDLAALQTVLGLGSMSAQDSSNVLITGGNVNAIIGGGVPMAASVTKLTFPGTFVASADPYTMDDYREVDYTPTVTAGTTPPTGVTYTTRLASYTKAGRLTVVNSRVRLANLGAGGVGDVRVTLPFTALKDAAVTVGISDNATGVASGSLVSAAIVAGTDYIAMRIQSANTTGQLVWSNLTNSWEVFLTASYFAA